MARPGRKFDDVRDWMPAVIRGAVNARLQAVVRLRLRGPGGVEADTDALIDTGFTSYLTLPPAMIFQLGLARQSGGSARLADGSLRQFATRLP